MSDYTEAVRQKFTIAAKLRHLQPIIDNRIVTGETDELASNIRALIGSTLHLADTYYWAHDIASVVHQSSLVLPGDTRLVFEGAGPAGLASWHWFDKPIQIVKDDDGPIDGLLWIPMERQFGREPVGLIAAFVRDPAKPDSVPQPRHCIMLRSGISVDEEAGWPKQRESGREIGPEEVEWSNQLQGSLVRMFLSMRLWVEQDLLVPTRQPVQRNLRRQLEREHRPEQRLNVVLLRRAIHQAAETGEARPGSVDYQCQWLVGIHWRQQFYPSTGEHRPKLILPYIKGPADKPLKPPTGSIFAVTR